MLYDIKKNFIVQYINYLTNDTSMSFFGFSTLKFIILKIEMIGRGTYVDVYKTKNINTG